jgi:hypothetical protein
LFKTVDYKCIKKHKNKHFIFERIEDEKLHMFSSTTVCVDNSNFWTGTDVIIRYQTLFPNIKNIYVVCDVSNLNIYSQCFSNDQTFLILNNGLYYVNRTNKKVEVL